jgi:hypothetical protein
MWPKFFNSKWFERLFTATLSIMLLLITQRFVVMNNNTTKENDDKIRIETELGKKATIVYVDERDKEIKDNCHKEISDVKSNVESTVKTFSKDMSDVRDDIHEIRNFIFNHKLSKLDTIKLLTPIGCSKVNNLTMLKQLDLLSLSMLAYDRQYKLIIR